MIANERWKNSDEFMRYSKKSSDDGKEIKMSGRNEKDSIGSIINSLQPIKTILLRSPFTNP